MMKFRSGTVLASGRALRAPVAALCAGGLALLAGAAASITHAADQALSSAWVDGFNNKARLIAGRARAEAGEAVFAGIEIAMPAGWKTYWKAPGDAGGIPPEFDFSQSDNLAAAEVLYPAPHRLLDKAGATIGYKDRVVFPVRLKAKEESKAIGLKLKAAYGVCKELCVPAEAEITLDVPATAAAAPAELSAALARVPRTAPLADRDPVLTTWKVEDRDGKPTLVLDVTDPGGAGGDLFAFGPDGLYMPLAKKLTETANGARYALDLTDGVEIKDLKGKPIGVTLVGQAGQSQTTIVLP